LVLQQRERERTGAKALKVGYNRVFGYYLEISASALAQPLDHYRRQEMGVETVGQLLEQLGEAPCSHGRTRAIQRVQQ